MQKTPCIAAEISPGKGRSRAWHEFDKTSGLRWMLGECLNTRKTPRTYEYIYIIIYKVSARSIKIHTIILCILVIYLMSTLD